MDEVGTKVHDPKARVAEFLARFGRDRNVTLPPLSAEGVGSIQHQRAKLLFERLPPRQVVENGARMGVLLVGPGADFWSDLAHALGVRVVALEPAVVVQDLDSVERLPHRLDPRRRRLRRGLSGNLAGENDNGERGEQQERELHPDLQGVGIPPRQVLS